MLSFLLAENLVRDIMAILHRITYVADKSNQFVLLPLFLFTKIVE